MKINHLDLIAYGHFTNVSLPLAESGFCFSLIYGANESGKSTALRAITSLLFGIESRTTDDFLHSYDQLFVGGELERDDGQTLNFIRKKGNKNTLSDANNANSANKLTIDDQRLQAFVPGLDRDLFCSRYGINHEQLVAGGKSILANQGDSTSTLYSAATSLMGLRQLLATLDEKAKELYLAKGRSKPKLIQLGIEYKEKRKERDQIALRASKYLQHEHQRDLAQKRLNQLEEQRKKLELNQRHLDRLRSAIPLAASQRRLQLELESQASTVILKRDFPERRERAYTEWSQKELQTAQKDQEILSVFQQLQALEISESILERGTEINDLHVKLGEYLKAKKDLPERQHLLENEEHTIRRILREMAYDFDPTQPDYLELARDKLSLSKARIDRITVLSNAHAGRLEGLSAAEKQVDRLHHDLIHKQAEIETFAPLQDLTELRAVVARARKAGALEDDLRTQREKIAGEERQTELEVGRLAWWKGELAALERMTLPLSETIAALESRFVRCQTEQKSQLERRKGLEATIRDRDKQIQAAQLSGEVPTEGGLVLSRERRDRAWSSLEKAFRQQGVTPEVMQWKTSGADPDSDLVQLFPRLIKEADDLGDRLRREADRVARQAQWIAEKIQLELELSEVKTMQAATQLESLELDQKWRALWPFLTLEQGQSTPTPGEMKTWLARAQKLQESCHKLASLLESRNGLQNRIQLLIQDVLGALGRLEEGVAPAIRSHSDLEMLLQRAESVLKKNDELRERRNAIEAALNDLLSRQHQAEQEVRDKRAALEKWQAEWQDAISGLEISHHASPTEASTQVAQIRDFMQHYEEIRKLRVRIRGMERDNEEIRAKVHQVCEAVAPELILEPLDRAVNTLNEQFRKQNELATKRETLRQRHEDLTVKRECVRLESEAARKGLEACLQEAGCERYEELSEVEERSRGKEQKQRELEGIRRSLVELAVGLEPDAWLSEIEAGELDRVEEALERVRQELEQISTDFQREGETVGREKQELERHDGTSRAAALTQDGQFLLTEMRSGLDEYIRLRLAYKLLWHEMETWRQQNQGPLLRRSSELFSRLTLERFSRLEVEYDDKERQYLKAVRAGGTNKVQVDGLSDGTRDQLFLALRLASLELELAHREKVPLIVDDILINFDDERSAATLTLLAEFAKKTQVIFFTHHEHLAELAAKVLQLSPEQYLRLR